MSWVIKGLKTGIVTTTYPQREERSEGVSPGLPHGGSCDEEAAKELTARCPTEALHQDEGKMIVDYSRCVHCYRCVRGVKAPASWELDYEWAKVRREALVFPGAFRHSLHIRVIDAGNCGACLNEVKLLNNPYYNMHRLGFFITPTPRQADVLLVVGPITDHMRTPLLKAYEAMPAPKRVMAVGACALTGGIFGPSFVSGSGAASVIPVDVEVPGCPPPPLAILHGLLMIAGRKKSSSTLKPARPSNERWENSE